jgi:hypothetical protein
VTAATRKRYVADEDSPRTVVALAAAPVRATVVHVPPFFDICTTKPSTAERPVYVGSVHFTRTPPTPGFAAVRCGAHDRPARGKRSISFELGAPPVYISIRPLSHELADLSVLTR